MKQEHKIVVDIKGFGVESPFLMVVEADDYEEAKTQAGLQLLEAFNNIDFSWFSKDVRDLKAETEHFRKLFVKVSER